MNNFTHNSTIKKYLNPNGRYSALKSEKVREAYKEEAHRRIPHVEIDYRKSLQAAGKLFTKIFT